MIAEIVERVRGTSTWQSACRHCAKGLWVYIMGERAGTGKFPDSCTRTPIRTLVRRLNVFVSHRYTCVRSVLWVMTKSCSNTHWKSIWSAQSACLRWSPPFKLGVAISSASLVLRQYWGKWHHRYDSTVWHIDTHIRCRQRQPKCPLDKTPLDTSQVQPTLTYENLAFPLAMSVSDSLLQLFPDNYTNKQLLGLTVLCNNQDFGCCWEGQLKELEVWHADLRQLTLKQPVVRKC